MVDCCSPSISLLELWARAAAPLLPFLDRPLAMRRAEYLFLLPHLVLAFIFSTSRDSDHN